MRRIKIAFMIVITVAMLHSQMTASAAAETGSPADPPEGITENEPQIISSEEVSFGRQKPAVRKRVWLAVGAAVITGIVLGVAGGGGGGGDSSGPVGPVSGGNGQVSFDW